MTEQKDIYNERYGVTISESGEVYIYDLETEKPKELVAEVFGQDEEAVALANLMAAAPDLLEAAGEAAKIISKSIDKDSRIHENMALRDEYISALECVEKAIQKARGESNE